MCNNKINKRFVTKYRECVFEVANYRLTFSFTDLVEDLLLMDSSISRASFREVAEMVYIMCKN